MAKAPRLYVFTRLKTRTSDESHTSPMTLAEAIQYYKYTLETGRSWQHEKGNKKINCNPTTIKSLVTNLNNAVNNSAQNGYARIFYSAVEFVGEPTERLGVLEKPTC